MKICSLYGVGFYYVPGTDMCIKVGGWARYEQAYNYNGSMTTEFYANNVDNRSTHLDTWRVKGTATFDARSPTQYGTVRSYIAIGVSNNNNGDSSGIANYANRWFIQWAGFTIGHSTSFYDFYSIGANQYGFVTASSDSGDGGWDVFAYTAQFGNGFSGSISAEVQRRTYIAYAGTGGGGIAGTGLGTVGGLPFFFLPTSNTLSVNYEGHDYPDLVGNLRVDQTWGSAQVMGALHNVAATYYGTAPFAGSFTPTLETAGHPSDQLGFAVGAGIKLNAPMIGPGDYFQIEGDYTQGALRYLNMTAFPWNFSRYEGNTFGFGIQSDAVYGGSVAGGAPSSLELTTAWAVNAAYTHNWSPDWKSTLWGSYFAANFNNNANAMLCQAIGHGVNSGTAAIANPGCDMNWAAWGGGLRTQWAVSSTFQIGLEVMYANLHTAQTETGTVVLPLNTFKPAGAYTLTDQDLWAVRLRVNRDFYP